MRLVRAEILSRGALAGAFPRWLAGRARTQWHERTYPWEVVVVGSNPTFQSRLDWV